MSVVVPLVGSSISRIRSSYEANGESEMSKEGLIKQIFGSSYGVHVW